MQIFRFIIKQQTSAILQSILLLLTTVLLSRPNSTNMGGTAAAVPPPFRRSEPALCGSHPLVTPYYCRLGDLLCFVFIVRLLCFSVIDVLYVFLQYFDTVGWVI